MGFVTSGDLLFTGSLNRIQRSGGGDFNPDYLSIPHAYGPWTIVRRTPNHMGHVEIGRGQSWNRTMPGNRIASPRETELSEGPTR
jgi:hypothetical protein